MVLPSDPEPNIHRRTTDVSPIGEVKGNPAIVYLVNEAGAWPDSIRVVGNVKCLTCRALAVDQVLCVDCRDIFRLLRAGDNFANLLRLLARPGFLTVFEQVTEDQYADHLLRRMDALPGE